MFALSTIWNRHKYTDWGKYFDEVSNLGFDSIQLSRDIPEKTLNEMLPSLSNFNIVSVHNFCPVPPATKNALENKLLFSSSYKDDRSAACDLTKRTMELAADLGIPVVVLHLGKVEIKDAFDMRSDQTYRLVNLYEKGEREFELFRSLFNEFRPRREFKQDKHRSAVLFSLDELNEYAIKLELLLAIENRQRYHQIPDFDELELFFEEFEGGNLRYWHDVGHAFLQEQLGICKQDELLERYSENRIGVELHDVKELEEYLPPGEGEMDFKEIFEKIPKEAIKVLEIRDCEKDKLAESIELLASEWKEVHGL